MAEVPNVRSSLQVAPLAIQKDRSASLSGESHMGDDAISQTESASTNPYSTSHMTPPTTPNGSQEDLTSDHVSPPVFHNFLRAFYPFQPTYAMSDSTVTLPLNEGDVVLVHSIHTNGWADGTLLASGARGWLPTNYCEAYDPEEMRNLLKALLNFWDLLRSSAMNDQEIFGNQEFMKGLIAGVRHLLERSHCLTREAAVVQRSDGLRRARKSLLSELSHLVKAAKRVQEMLKTAEQPSEEINDVIDQMILRAFKIVVKGVRFLDLLEEDRRLRAPPAVTVMATVVEESFVPHTPPEESSNSDHVRDGPEDAAGRCETDQSAPEALDSQVADGTQTKAPANHRSSAVGSTNGNNPSSLNSKSHGKRLSASITHRVSLTGASSVVSQPQNLVSERLNASHDGFLSQLGSFIGRLHLQSQSRVELALAIKQSATSGDELLIVIDIVCRHDTSGTTSLDQARSMMFERIRDLVHAARDVLTQFGPDADDVIMPHDNSRLLSAATSCVKAAGECVAKTKWVIERIGDFEFESQVGYVGLGIDLGFFAQISDSRPRTPERKQSVCSETKSSASTTPVRSIHVSMDKPLPQVPGFQPTETPAGQYSPPPSRPTSMVVDDVDSGMSSSAGSLRPLLPTLPRLSTSINITDSYSPATEDSHDEDYQSSFRSDTTTSSSGSNSTFVSRDSESSIISQTSTRATTPDSAMVPRSQPSLSELSVAGSGGTSEEVDEVESRLLERTYAHELMFNKEGQVTGGSIQALVERLTTHESTPDAMFVSAFYLTFRLFCTPIKLAESLIDRFDYVGEAPHMANAVRLRVYNVVKGWLETHWREPTDQDALPLIHDFAENKLSPLLPSAGKRLLELSERVTSTDGSLVPRLVSSMGKTNTSITQFVPADTPLPNSVISRSQQYLLNNWKNGGTCPTVLDFEPLEIARQITMRQMSIFCSIQPEELLGSQWMKKGGVDSPNVKAMTALSTDLSNFVADTILHFLEVKKRAVVIKQWIKIAEQCLELNNYDGLMAIICSLNSSQISRLRKTWELVSQKRRDRLKILQAIVEPSNNMKRLRARLQDHVPPCLPFLGMFLTDLTFVDIGNPATKQLPSSSSEDQGLTVVNFDKHTRTAKIIGELQRFQIPYRLHEVADLQEWIQAQISRVKDSDEGNIQVSYYRKSLLLEPRESATRTASESAPAAAPATANQSQKADLFGWMSRERHPSNAGLSG